MFSLLENVLCGRNFYKVCQNLTFIAKSSTRRITIYINGKEGEALIKKEN